MSPSPQHHDESEPGSARQRTHPGRPSGGRRRGPRIHLILLVAVLLCPWGAPALALVHVPGGVINQDTTWQASSSPYVLDGSVTVAAGRTLTIEPGVVVKATPLINLGLYIQGTLSADAGGGRIWFTSLRDDSAGGDTNQDGNASSPSAGDWRGIKFEAAAAGNVLTGVEVRFGGASYWSTGGDSSSVYSATSDLVISASTIMYSVSAGVFVTGAAHPSLLADTFTGNAGCAVALGGIDATRAAIGSCTASGNGVDGVCVPGGTLAANPAAVIWSSSLPYVLEGSVTVPSVVALTIQPGVMVKASPQTSIALYVQGTLNADGTSGRIWFTSLKDDSIGGDTNHDYGVLAPAPGDWKGIYFDTTSTASVLRNVEVRYAGASYWLNGGDSSSVFTRSSALSIDNVDVSAGAAAGIYLGAGVVPSITGASITGNGGCAVGLGTVDSTRAVVQWNYASGNGTDGICVPGGTFATNPATAAWGANLPYVLLGSVTVPSVVTLSLDPGAVVKVAPLANLALVVQGTLHADGGTGPIWFTSLRDDTVMGDTNRDGSLSGPGPGDWKGLYFAAGSVSNVLDNVQVRYAGSHYWVNGGDDSSIYTAVPLAIGNSTITSGLGAGICANGAAVSVTDSTLTHNATGIRLVQSPDAVLTGNAITGNTGYAILCADAVSSSSTVEGNTIWSNGTDAIAVGGGTMSAATTAATWSADAPYLLLGSVGVPAGVTLSFDPGAMVKASALGNYGLYVYGTLHADGNEGRIVFTSLRDDTAGGDTNRDGSASSPGAGDWRGIYFDPASTGNVLFKTDVRYAGSSWWITGGDVSAIYAGTSSLAIGYSTIAGGASSGVYIAGAAHPSILSTAITGHAGCAVVLATIDSARAVIQSSTATGNGTNGICVPAGTLGTSPAAVTWGSNLPYVFLGSVVVPSVVSLTVQPGVVVKVSPLAGIGLVVQGTLVADGALGRIYFTSLRDDSVAGDTNHDGGVTGPGAGEWDGIYFDPSSTGSVLNKVDVRFGGQTYWVTGGDNASIYAGSSSLAISGVAVTDGAGAGIYVGSAASPTLGGLTITGNGGCAIALAHVDSARAAMQSNLADGNGTDGVCVPGGTLSLSPAAVTWGSNIPYVLQGSVTVPSVVALSIDPGVVVKVSPLANLGLVILGSLHAAGATGRIWFTSLRDDTVAGDTNHDGALTGPSAGDWRGIYFDAGSVGNVLDNVEVRFGGSMWWLTGGDDSSIYAATSALTIANSTVMFSESAGMRVTGNLVSPTIAAVRFVRNWNGLVFAGNARGVVWGSAFVGQNTAIVIDSGSMPMLGHAGDAVPLNQGLNSFACNTLNVCSANPATVPAQNNWWGADPPDPSMVCPTGPVDVTSARSAEVEGSVTQPFEVPLLPSYSMSAPGSLLSRLAVDRVSTGTPGAADIVLGWEDIAPSCGYDVYRSEEGALQSFELVSPPGGVDGIAFTDPGAGDTGGPVYFYSVRIR